MNIRRIEVSGRKHSKGSFAKETKRLIAWLAAVICILGLFSGTTVYADTEAENQEAEAQEAETQEAVVQEAEEAVSDPVISLKKLYLKPGQKKRLKVTGNIGKVKWVSKNPDIAKVSSKGLVTALSEGTVRIYAKVDGKSLRCTVKVIAEKEVKIIAVGDNLYHQAIIDSGKTADGKYNYDNIYANIKDYISDADVRIINQETVFVKDAKDYSGYPTFGTPLASGKAIRKAGFNVITMATNHSNDKLANGINTSLEFWRKYADDILTVGMYDNEDDYNTIAIREYNGIKIAFLNYTYGINGSTKYLPHSYSLKFLKEDQVIRDIKAAKKEADIVIVLPHWGTEYVTSANSTQKSLAKKMAEAGATAIIGTHPHVVEPLEIIKTSDGREVPCYYSLGNFVANMYAMDRQLEGMAELKIKVWNGQVTIDTAELTPLVCHIYNHGKSFTVYRLEDYTDEIAKGYVQSGHTPKKLWELFNSIVK